MSSHTKFSYHLHVLHHGCTVLRFHPHGSVKFFPLYYFLTLLFSYLVTVSLHMWWFLFVPFNGLMLNLSHLIFYLYVLFCIIFGEILCPFNMRLCVSCSGVDFLHILDINPLSVIWSVDVFSLPIGRLLPLRIVHFAWWNFWSFAIW